VEVVKTVIIYFQREYCHIQTNEGVEVSKSVKILVVEDDNDINHMLCELLEQNDYMSVPAFSGTEALMHIRDDSFNLILLDLMLPGKSGEVVLSEIRENSLIPVIVITAIGLKDSVVSTLRLGANDYIVKPFDNNELLARIEVHLRQNVFHPDDGREKVLTYRDLVLDLERFDGMINNHFLQLSKREYEILKLLMENPRKVYTKNNLYESVWNDEFLGDDNTINVHISNIRSKIGKLQPATKYIQTVWGIGYKMQE